MIAVIVNGLSNELDLDVTVTTHKGHGIVLGELALAQGLDIVITLGGDGVVNEVVNGIIKRQEMGDFVVDLGRTEAILPRKEQSRAETYQTGDRVRVAIVKVLKSAGKPLNVNAVLDGLKKAKYVFTAKDAKKNLAARIYKLSGVKQVGPGLFAAGK